MVGAAATAADAEGPNWNLGLGGRNSGTTEPFASYSNSRTVSAWMGTATTWPRVAVVISAVQVNPGRTSGICSSMVTVTLKFVAVRAVVCSAGAPVC